MKSIAKSDQIELGMVSGCNILVGWRCSVLNRWQVAQPLMNSRTNRLSYNV
jgi:hypothetical protein